MQESRENRLEKHNRVTEVQGIKPEHVVKASNGNIYIKNARVYSGSKDNPEGRVSVETGVNTRNVIIKNVKVSSRNNSSSSRDSDNAVLSVKAKENTNISIKNSNIKSHNVDLKSFSSNEKVCAGALCIQANENSNILVKNTKVSTSSSDVTISRNNSSKKNCAGALCIQTEDSSVDVINTTVTSYGSNDFEILD
ncbi:MAG TPA: hypothetical protein ENK66_01175 [Arcobacter sp.]|nr:hypothetical protein [Arcobacter sp.]